MRIVPFTLEATCASTPLTVSIYLLSMLNKLVLSVGLIFLPTGYLTFNLFLPYLYEISVKLKILYILQRFHSFDSPNDIILFN